jgi:hypothetical protein
MAGQLNGRGTETGEEWRAARLELLEAEKELTRRSDELAQQRHEPALGLDREGVRVRDGRGEESSGEPKGAPRRAAVANLDN